MLFFIQKILFVLILVFGVTFDLFPVDEPLRVSFFNFSPLMIVEDNNTRVVGGTIVTLTKKILERAGIDYTITGYPAPRLYKNLTTGETQLWTGIHTTGLYIDMVEMGTEVLDNIELRIYSKAPMIPPKTLDDLKGKSLLILRGFTYGGRIHFLKDQKNNINIDQTIDHVNALLKLYHGRQPFLLNYKGPVDLALTQAKLESKEFNFSVIEKIPIHFIISKKTPNAKKLLSTLEDTFRQMKKEKLLS